jgi:hypothetical protein
MLELVHVLATTLRAIRINLAISGVVALIAGILILFLPKLFRVIVGGYLLFVGLIHVFNLHF